MLVQDALKAWFRSEAVRGSCRTLHIWGKVGELSVIAASYPQSYQKLPVVLIAAPLPPTSSVSSTASTAVSPHPCIRYACSGRDYLQRPSLMPIWLAGRGRRGRSEHFRQSTGAKHQTMSGQPWARADPQGAAAHPFEPPLQFRVHRPRARRRPQLTLSWQLTAVSQAGVPISTPQRSKQPVMGGQRVQVSMHTDGAPT